MARPIKDPITIIDLKTDGLRFPGREKLVGKVSRFLDYYRNAKRTPPAYITILQDDLDKAREAALSRKKKRAAPGVSFAFDGIPLAGFYSMKRKEG